MRVAVIDRLVMHVDSIPEEPIPEVHTRPLAGVAARQETVEGLLAHHVLRHQHLHVHASARTFSLVLIVV